MSIKTKRKAGKEWCRKMRFKLSKLAEMAKTKSFHGVFAGKGRSESKGSGGGELCAICFDCPPMPGDTVDRPSECGTTFCSPDGYVQLPCCGGGGAEETTTTKFCTRCILRMRQSPGPVTRFPDRVRCPRCRHQLEVTFLLADNVVSVEKVVTEDEERDGDTTGDEAGPRQQGKSMEELQSLLLAMTGSAALLGIAHLVGN